MNPPPNKPHSHLGPGYWEQRYRQGQTGWDLGGPTPALTWLVEKGLFPVSSPASVLVPGCGYGHDALYLASRGYEVTAIDWAPEALSPLQTHAPPHLRTICADFFAYAENTSDRYDAIWEYTFYCAIDPTLRPAYFAAIGTLLKAGGYWIALIFPLESQPYDMGPPFAIEGDEVQSLSKSHGLRYLGVFPDAPSHPARQGRERLALFRKHTY
mgnify:CR=1 FL=1